MRGWKCVPMITLCLTLAACAIGAEEQPDDAAALRDAYHDMGGCVMEAEVLCGGGETETAYTLRCDYGADGKATVEVLAPETVAGVKAVLDGTGMALEYEDVCLDAGPLSEEEISPAACLPRLMSALRDGWLLEENKETWNDIPCLRLTVDQSGLHDGKIVSTVWLRLEDGKPLRGEIAVDGEIILTAEFTSFEFYDTLSQ